MWTGVCVVQCHGRHVVVVDDLVQSGGTLIECGHAVRRAGAAAVSCYVTHAVFPNESWRKFTAPGAGFQYFWVTVRASVGSCRVGPPLLRAHAEENHTCALSSSRAHHEEKSTLCVPVSPHPLRLCCQNSIPTSSDMVSGQPPFEVLSIAKVILSSLQ